MSWLKFDDRILDHPKFVRAERGAGSTAFHLWVGFVSYAKQHRTDGWVPFDMLNCVNGPRRRYRLRALAALVDAGLVEREGDRLHVHDYLDWNASRKEIEHGRKGSEPPAASGVRVAVASDTGAGSVRVALDTGRSSVKVASAHVNGSAKIDTTLPRTRSESESESESEFKIPHGIPQNDPSPPAPPPIEKKTSHRAGKRICPANFEPNPAVLKLATELGYSEVLERSTRVRMIDWSIGKAEARADWQATYRNWLRKDAEERGLKPVQHDPQRERYLEEKRRATEPVKNPIKPPVGIENKILNLFRGGAH
jgi:hypothetical protein